MKQDGLVSVIIPAYNAEATIQQTIRSVLSQTYKNYEIIVVDDGSRDATAEIVRQYDTVRYIYQENQGVSAARNRGLRESKGEWIAFLDADDEWHQEKLTIQMSYIGTIDNLVFISNVPLIVRQGEKKDYPVINPAAISYFQWRQEEFLRRNTVHTSSVVIQKDILLKVGGSDETLPNAGDRDLWLKVLYNGTGICLTIPLTKYFHLGGSLSKHVVRRFSCDLILIDRWDQRKPDTLDVDKRIAISVFIRTKYSVLYTMIFKLLCLHQDEDARVFWGKLHAFHEREFSHYPMIPWSFFKLLRFLEATRKRIKYGKQS